MVVMVMVMGMVMVVTPHLTQNALGIDEVLEGIGDLLDGHLAVICLVARGAHHTVGAAANGFDGLVSGREWVIVSSFARCSFVPSFVRSFARRLL